VDLDNLKKLIAIFETSSLAEIEVEDEALRVRLTKPSGVVQQVVGHAHAPMSAPAAAAAPAAVAAPEPPAAITIDSPMVGTFYAASSPGDPPFVTPGTTVQPGQNVCIIEAMKIMNEVTAARACVIEKVLVENEQPVEFGQPLFEVRYI
jgi:acetyl-CoA carboxylase biotin carboxyl carrier protein